jgi:hypothetical protein
MGYYKENTVEIEINGQKVRVFKQEADALKTKLLSKKTKSKE